MQQDLAFRGPSIAAGLILSIVFCLLFVVGAVLALVSRTWRARLAQVALHALWIIPVVGLFAAAISWRVHQARLQVVTATEWPSPTSLTVPRTSAFEGEGPLPIPRTETFRVPTTTIHYSVSPTWGLIALVGVGVLLVGGLAWRFLRRHAAAMIPVVAVVAAVAIAGAGLVASFAVRQQHVSEWQRVRVEQMLAVREAVQARQAAPAATKPHPSQVLDFRGQSAESNPPVAAGETEEPAGRSPGTEIVAYIGSVPTGEPLTELPAWTKEVAVDDDVSDSPTRTYSSGLWVTNEEADRELLLAVAPELQQYFWTQHPAAAGWSPAPELILPSGAVARRCYESVPVQFGEHTQTMHRAYWQISRRPEVARYFFEQWRPLAVRQRLIWFAAAVGLLTLICGALGAYYRVNAATAGRYRGQLRFATGAICVAGGLAAILLA